MSPLAYEIILQFLFETTRGAVKEELKHLLFHEGKNQLKDLFLKIAKIKESYKQGLNANLIIQHNQQLQFRSEIWKEVPHMEALDYVVEKKAAAGSDFAISCTIELKNLWLFSFEIPSEKYLLFQDEKQGLIPVKAIRQFTKNGLNKSKVPQTAKAL